MNMGHVVEYVAIGIVVAVVVFDFALAAWWPRFTVSKVILRVHQKHPSIGIAVGFVAGHIFWPQ